MHYQFLGYAIADEYDDIPFAMTHDIPATEIMMEQSMPVDTSAELSTNETGVVTVPKEQGVIQEGISRVRDITNKPDFIQSAIVGAIAAILLLKILR